MNRKISAVKSVVVMGLGTFGAQTAKAIYEGGIAVLAFDQDQHEIDAIKDHVTHAVCADVLNVDALRAAGAFDVDMAIVALRRHFDTSILVTHTLKKEGVPEIYVRVDTEQEAEAIAVVGATSVIFPERDMAVRIAQKILIPGVTENVPLGPDISIIEMPIPEAFVGRTLMQLDVRNKHGVTIIAIGAAFRGEERIEVAPAPNLPLPAGTSLFVLGKTDELNKFRMHV